jgi:hypothetical protein
MLTKIFLYFHIDSRSYLTLGWTDTGILTTYLPHPEKSYQMITLSVQTKPECSKAKVKT